MGIRDWMGKHERAAVLGLVTILLVTAAVIAFTSLGGSRYHSITVTYEQLPEGVRVTERLETTVSASDSFNVLYRSFDQAVCGQGSECDITITDVRCERGTAYTKDSFGEVSGSPPASIAPKLRNNEFGCYDEEGYSGQQETITATYEVAQSAVDRNGGKHSLFSNEHLPVSALTVVAISGSDSARFIGAGQGVNLDTRSGLIDTEGMPTIAFLALLLLLSIMPYIAWRVFGTEKQFTVPEYLHVMPAKREHWQVDVLTNGKGTLGKNGLAAITLSLQVKGVLRLEKGSFGRITAFVKKDHKATLTQKEQKFLDLLLLDKESEDASEIRADVRPKRHRMKWIAFRNDTGEFYKTMVDKKGNVIQGVAIALAFGLIYIATDVIPAALFVYLVIMIAGLALIPSSVFSRFKGDNYKEYLEWLSFKGMLSDFAKIQKYLQDDHDQWKDWLVYGAALGVANEVLKALEKTNILDLARIEDLRTSYAMGAAFAVSTSRSGGAGGGGGGFGGGGGGGR